MDLQRAMRQIIANTCPQVEKGNLVLFEYDLHCATAFIVWDWLDQEIVYFHVNYDDNNAEERRHIVERFFK